MQQPEEKNCQHSPFDFNELVPPIPAPKAQYEQTQPSDNIVFTDEPNLKVFCHDCRKEINKIASILSNSLIYRCVGCYAKLQPKDECYQVIKSLTYPVIDSNWKAVHQILFLNFLQKLGFGNWKEIKDQMDFYGAKHSEEQLQNHYYNCYLGNEDFLPKFLNNDNFFQKRCEQINSLKNAAANPTSIASLTTQQHAPDQFEEIDDFYPNHLTVQGKQANFLECFNEKRNQFDVEYDQQAEMILANLQFRDDDTEEEMRIKFQLLEEYNRRLDRRNQIKRFILEHRLLQDNYQKEMDRCRSDLEKQAFQDLKPIARFTTLTQYNQLVQKVAFTKQLKSIIEGLRKFRRTHPSNFKSLDQFLNNQPEQSKPKKKGHIQNGVKSGKKVQEMLQKHFKLNKKDFQNLISNLAANGKKIIYKNVEAVMLNRNSE